jgi:hypothetical protein
VSGDEEHIRVLIDGDDDGSSPQGHDDAEVGMRDKVYPDHRSIKEASSADVPRATGRRTGMLVAGNPDVIREASAGKSAIDTVARASRLINMVRKRPGRKR